MRSAGVSLGLLALGLVPGSAQNQIFEIDTAATPGEAVFLLGSQECLGGNHVTQAVMLAPQGEGKWGGRIRLSGGPTGTYQYLRRKTGAKDFEDANNAVFLSEPRVMREVKGGKRTELKQVSGTGKLEEPKFLDSMLQEFPGRRIRVWLPPGYETGKRKYPVVYVHDGQNVFDPGGPFGSWSADKVAEEEMRSGRVRPAILVGIDNTPDRVREYLPPPDVVPEGRPAAGEVGRADLYARYLLEVVKPYVDRTYRTLSERENTLVLGSSMGGVVSHYLLESHGNSFSAAGVFSPAYWASPKFFAESVRKPKPDGRIYLDMGTREGRSYWPDVIRIYQHWVRGGAVILGDIWFQPGICAEHNEKAWKDRLPTALQFLLLLEVRN